MAHSSLTQAKDFEPAIVNRLLLLTNKEELFEETILPARYRLAADAAVSHLVNSLLLDGDSVSEIVIIDGRYKPKFQGLRTSARRSETKSDLIVNTALGRRLRISAKMTTHAPVHQMTTQQSFLDWKAAMLESGPAGTAEAFKEAECFFNLVGYQNLTDPCYKVRYTKAINHPRYKVPSKVKSKLLAEWNANESPMPNLSSSDLTLLARQWWQKTFITKPDVIRHITLESITGAHIFGKEADGTAEYVLTPTGFFTAAEYLDKFLSDKKIGQRGKMAGLHDACQIKFQRTPEGGGFDPDLSIHANYIRFTQIRVNFNF